MRWGGARLAANGEQRRRVHARSTKVLSYLRTLVPCHVNFDGSTFCSYGDWCLQTGASLQSALGTLSFRLLRSFRRPGRRRRRLPRFFLPVRRALRPAAAARLRRRRRRRRHLPELPDRHVVDVQVQVEIDVHGSLAASLRVHIVAERLRERRLDRGFRLRPSRALAAAAAGAAAVRLGRLGRRLFLAPGPARRRRRRVHRGRGDVRAVRGDAPRLRRRSRGAGVVREPHRVDRAVEPQRPRVTVRRKHERGPVATVAAAPAPPLRREHGRKKHPAEPLAADFAPHEVPRVEPSGDDAGARVDARAYPLHVAVRVRGVVRVRVVVDRVDRDVVVV
eukprot:31432-Pelagococcus_subviridis.AAC.4